MSEATELCIQELLSLKKPNGAVVDMSDHDLEFDRIVRALERLVVLPVDIIPTFVWFDLPMDTTVYETPMQCIDLAVEETAVHLVRRTGEHSVILRISLTDNQTNYSWLCPTKEGLIQKWGLVEDQLTDFFSENSVLGNIDFYD